MVFICRPVVTGGINSIRMISIKIRSNQLTVLCATLESFWQLPYQMAKQNAQVNGRSNRHLPAAICCQFKLWTIFNFMPIAHLFLQLMFNYDKTSMVEYTTMVNLCQWCTGTEYYTCIRWGPWMSNGLRGSCESYLRWESHQTLWQVKDRSRKQIEPFHKNTK